MALTTIAALTCYAKKHEKWCFRREDEEKKKKDQPKEAAKKLQKTQEKRAKATKDTTKQTLKNLRRSGQVVSVSEASIIDNTRGKEGVLDEMKKMLFRERDDLRKLILLNNAKEYCEKEIAKNELKGEELDKKQQELDKCNKQIKEIKIKWRFGKKVEDRLSEIEKLLLGGQQVEVVGGQSATISMKDRIIKRQEKYKLDKWKKKKNKEEEKKKEAEVLTPEESRIRRAVDKQQRMGASLVVSAQESGQSLPKKKNKQKPPLDSLPYRYIGGSVFGEEEHLEEGHRKAVNEFMDQSFEDDPVLAADYFGVVEKDDSDNEANLGLSDFGSDDAEDSDSEGKNSDAAAIGKSLDDEKGDVLEEEVMDFSGDTKWAAPRPKVATGRLAALKNWFGLGKEDEATNPKETELTEVTFGPNVTVNPLAIGSKIARKNPKTAVNSAAGAPVRPPHETDYDIEHL